MSPNWRIFYYAFIFIVLQGNFYYVKSQNRLKTCCDIGTSWAKEDLRCEKYSGPVPDIPQAEQAFCLQVIDNCCIRASSEKDCEEGKQAARKGADCNQSSNKGKDCCKGCELGKLAGTSGQECNLNGFSFGESWNSAYLECCDEVLKSTTTSSTSESNISSTSIDNDSSSSKTSPSSFSSTSPSSPSSTSSNSLSTSPSSSSSTSSNSSSTSPSSSLTSPSSSSTLSSSSIESSSSPPNSSTSSATSSTSSNSSTTSLNTSTVPTSPDSSTSFNSSTSASLSTSSTSSSPGSTDHFTTIPTPPLDDICILMEGLLCSHVCVPSPGSYHCECPQGYVLLEDKKTCKEENPIDRCESDNPCEHQCIDTGTAVKCECDPGFQLAKDGHSCEHKPIETNIIAPESSTPSKINDKKKPLCPPGYEYNSSARVCDDIDECQENPCPIDKKCENVIGSFICTIKNEDFYQSMMNGQQNIKEFCPPGYQWDEILENCVDIDECFEFDESPCPTDTDLCVNTQGSFTCHELTASKACPAGFKFNITTKACQDVDECAEGLHGCLAQVEECRNTEGAYECDVQCRKGFFFSRNLGYCVDVNECQEIENPCLGIRSICVNTPGAYQCRKPSEFRKDNLHLNDSENELIDNEFAASKNIEEKYIVNQIHLNKSLPRSLSSSSSSSSSSPSSSSSLSPKFSALKTSECELGFYKNDDKCVDINECIDGPGCQDHERCINRHGGYDCLPLCNPGWFFDPLIKQCQDVDECLLGRHDCVETAQICKNTNGSYICETVASCSPGFRRSFNGSCIDIDECNEKLHSCSNTLHQYCVNRIGTYDCVTRLPDCMDGYRYSLASQRCEDIDECATRFPCDSRLSEKCVNVPGSYRCERPVTIMQTRRRPACPTGYRYDSNTRQCEDINECEEQKHLCNERETCYNQPGGYTCAQPPAPFTEPTVQDKESSTVDPQNPQKCQEGMKFIRNRGCVDIDECKEVEDACTSNEECVNTVGSFICNCRMGFRRENLTMACVDINECQLQNDCLPSQRCDNTVGSYNCVRFLPCGTGYTLNAATEICEDDDECILGTHDCGDGYHCRNTLGSYRCDKNTRDQTKINRPLSKTTRPFSKPTTPVMTTTAKPTTPRPTTIKPSTPRPTTMKPSTPRPTTIKPSTPRPTTSRTTATILKTSIIPTIDSRYKPEPEPRSCVPGFKLGPNGQCEDIDECELEPSPCSRSPLQRCLNTMGSYRCVSRILCAAGMELDPATSRCIDIDECTENTHECGPDQICKNRQGGYSCTCPLGHTIGRNKDCIDIDECNVFGGNICGSSGRCVNTPGSYQCVCEEGFEKSRQGNTCQDINECEKNPRICQHNCVNDWGSYRCSCKPGFRLSSDNKSCTDIDECEEFKENNLCVGLCENSPGSYSCNCPNGYRLGLDGRTCQDIDECAAGRVCRNSNEVCQNTRGSFRCNKINCPSGYHLDPRKANRCVRSSRYCPSGDLACFRSPSHYSYNFITFVSRLPLSPTGQVELFTMRGVHMSGSVMRFSMAFIDARAPPGIMRATESCFALRRPSPSQAVLVLTRVISGPQEIELNLSMEIYHNTAFVGSAVAKIFIYVSQYEF